MQKFRPVLEKHSMAAFPWRQTPPGSGWSSTARWISAQTGSFRFDERSRRLTEQLQQEQMSAQLEEKLRQSKPMALSEAKLVQAGSGYGVLGVHGKWASHLEFLDEEGHIKTGNIFWRAAAFRYQTTGAPRRFSQ